MTPRPSIARLAEDAPVPHDEVQDDLPWPWVAKTGSTPPRVDRLFDRDLATKFIETLRRDIGCRAMDTKS